MKTIHKQLLILCILAFSSSHAFAQLWQTFGNSVGPTDFFGSTNPETVRFRVDNNLRMRLMSGTGALAIGNGTFTPDAHLHANLLSYANTDGRLFRTDGSDTETLTWRMFSGTGVGNSTQKARFFLSPNTVTQNGAFGTGTANLAINHLVTESTLGDVIIQAAGATEAGNPGVLAERLRITSDYITDVGWGANPVSATRIGIPGRPGVNIRTPLSMIHMGDEWWYQLGGHREWMNSGTYAQRLNDNVFFGIRPREGSVAFGDQNDAIVAWGDNDTPIGRLDALRFVFCAPFSGSAAVGTAEHLNGLEIMRIHPQGNIGMGDFSVNGLNETPSEKLDIDGNVRIRQLPFNADPDVIIVGVEADTLGDYILHYTTTDGIGGTDCRWTDTPDAFTPNDFMFAGFDTAATCYRSKLAFGTNAANSKVEIENRTDRDSVSTGLDVVSVNTAPGWLAIDNNRRLIGISSLATLAQPGTSNAIFHIGMETIAEQGQIAVGLDALADRGVKNSIGVYSLARNSPSGENIAYYGEVLNNNDVFLYQVGGQSISTGPTINISDESVKTNISSLEGATDILDQLEIKTYNFVSPENRPIAFSERMQYGLIAQQVADVMPELVFETTVPELRDSLGVFVEGTSVDLLGINYDALVPILVAGFQEQNTLISGQTEMLAAQEEENQALKAQVTALTEQLESQRVAIDAMGDQVDKLMESVQRSESKMSRCCNNSSLQHESFPNEGIELNQNVPNPFSDFTRIDFTLPEAAQVVLEISDSQGRTLDKLVDGYLNAGTQSMTWDGSSCSPGVYYYSLFSNGQLLTKKMIKR